LTSIVTQATRQFLASMSYDDLTKSAGLAVVVILLVLLLQKEFARLHPGPRMTAWIHAFDLALVPLLVTFAIIVTARLAELLQ
jgi:hypothetical protein